MLDPRLDVLARGEPAVEHLAYQNGQLRIAGKAERDELSSRQLVDAWLQIGWQHLAQPQPHLEPDDAVLHRQRLSPREQAERAGISTADYFCGIAQTGELTREGVEQFLKSLPDGTTELICHPGYADDALQKSATRLQHSRQTELQILTDTGIRNLVASLGIRLIDYGFVSQEA